MIETVEGRASAASICTCARMGIGSVCNEFII